MGLGDLLAEALAAYQESRDVHADTRTTGMCGDDGPTADDDPTAVDAETSCELPRYRGLATRWTTRAGAGAESDRPAPTTIPPRRSPTPCCGCRISPLSRDGRRRSRVAGPPPETSGHPGVAQRSRRAHSAVPPARPSGRTKRCTTRRRSTWRGGDHVIAGVTGATVDGRRRRR